MAKRTARTFAVFADEKCAQYVKYTARTFAGFAKEQ
jgi:hypothetical protein